MFARVWRIAGSVYPDPDTIEALVGTVIAQIERLPGYCGGYFLAVREQGVIMRISFWDSLQHLRAADVMARNAVTGMMVVTDGASMSVEVCDVLVSDPPPPLRPHYLGGRR
jgi:hypothetical protein